MEIIHPGLDEIRHIISLPVSFEQISRRFIEYIDSSVTEDKRILKQRKKVVQ